MRIKSDEFEMAAGVTQSAVRDLMNTLPAGTLDDYRRTVDAPATPGDGWVVFDCAERGGLPLPLKPSDRTHPLWQEVAAAIKAEGGISVGVALKAHLGLFLSATSERPAGILIIPDAGILKALCGFMRDGPLTAAELRLTKQLICGMGLAEAARADRVSHETKRTQFKSLARKLAARSQSELTGRALTHLLIDLERRRAGTAMTQDDLFIELMREFVPQARCFELRGERGTHHRFIDLGPVDGRPVAFVHSQILPDIRPADIALLHEQGIRLIAPLRYGAISKAGKVLDVAAHLDHASEGIDLVRTHFAGARLDLMMTVSGCAFGIEYARRHAGRVRSLAFIGAPVRPIGNGTTAGRLRAGLFHLAAGNWGLLSTALDFYGRRINRPETFRRLLLNHYRPCPSDIAVVQTEYASSHGGERGRKLFAASMDSIKHDFLHQAFPRWQELPEGRFPIVFLHGEQDFIHPITGVRALARELGNLPVHAISGAGQLLYYQHFEPLLETYSAFLAQVSPARERTYRWSDDYRPNA